MLNSGIHNLMFQVELSKFVADHDFCLEIMYEEKHQPHVIIEKADTLKGSLVYFTQCLNNYTSNILHLMLMQFLAYKVKKLIQNYCCTQCLPHLIENSAATSPDQGLAIVLYHQVEKVQENLLVSLSHSVGISVKEPRGVVRWLNVWNFAQGLNKTDFHSKMSICRHELGVEHTPLDNSNNFIFTIFKSGLDYYNRWVELQKTSATVWENCFSWDELIRVTHYRSFWRRSSNQQMNQTGPTLQLLKCVHTEEWQMGSKM